MASSPATVAKAHLTPIKPNGGSQVGQPIEFQFNPKEYTVAKKAKWDQTPHKGAKKSPMPQFTGTESASVSLELLLDAFEGGDGKQTKIHDQVEALFKLVTPTTTSVKGQKPSPNWVLFGWGGRSGDPYIVESVQVKYTMFQADGTPVRALCTVSLKEAPIEVKKQNPSSGGMSSLRSHLVIEGDSLASIAYADLGDPSQWRVIAEINDIDDPFHLTPGRRLLIPDVAGDIPG